MSGTMSPTPPKPPLAAIGLLSAAVLAYEVLLMRLFAIVHWHHFAFMMISIALLGYGASGTLLTLLTSPRWRSPRTLFLAGACGFSFSSVLCFAAAQQIPFNALEVFWDPWQWGYLAAIHALLCLPFLSAASAIGAALKFPEYPLAKVYAADLTGAGLGACIAATGLLFLPPSGGLVSVAAGGMAAAVSAGRHWRVGRAWVVVFAAGGVFLVACGTAGWPAVNVNAYKPLAQMLRLPGARQIDARNHPLGWVSVVENSQIPLRHAPGLSLNSQAVIPSQIAVFVDGQRFMAVDRYDGRPATLAYLRQTTASLGLHLRPRPQRVLIVGAGGGQEMLRALAYDAGRIDAVEPHPLLSQAIEGKLRGFSGWNLVRTRTRLHRTTVRSFLQQNPTSRFDVVQFTIIGRGSGDAFGEAPLLTIEGLTQLWRHLADDGLLVMPLWTRLPPRASLKAFGMVLATLEAEGVAQPSHHVALIRDWGTAVLLVGQKPLGAEDRAAIGQFCRPRGFDVVYLPGRGEDRHSRRTIRSPPVLIDGARALAGEGRASFLARYKFDLRPPTDDKPFFGHYLRWRSLPEILPLLRSGGIRLLDWNYPVLLATLVQAVVFSLMLIGLPLVWRGGIRVRDGAGALGLTFVYFGAIGGGFIALEMVFMQRLALFLHHPLLAVNLTLGAFLVGAGGGSLIAHRMIAGGVPSRLVLPRCLGLIVLIGIIAMLAMPWMTARFIGMPLVFKLVLALVLMLPLAMALGTAFPLGIALWTRGRPGWVPWAWGINGCATVVGAVAVPLLVRDTGYTVMMALALLLYLAGLTAVVSIRGLKNLTKSYRQ